MLRIEHDFRHGHGEFFTIRACEKGMGHGPRAERLTLDEVFLAVRHCLGDKLHHKPSGKGVKGCPWCKDQPTADGREKGETMTDAQDVNAELLEACKGARNTLGRLALELYEGTEETEEAGEAEEAEIAYKELSAAIAKAEGSGT